MPARKRYALVGAGARARMFIDAIADPRKYAAHSQLVGLCDVNPTRMAWYQHYLQESFSYEAVPTFAAGEFDRMIQQTKPDAVIVTTVDAVHDQYIIRAMELGCDAITEKPMTIDERKAAAICDAAKRTGRQLRVTFNYRYMPGFTKLREIVASGEIGTPTLVDFQWRLDTSHGADYFRRWHREKQHSGGLLVHKATHHFDLVNFWLADYPKTVFALGDLMFYGARSAAKRGRRYNYDRYTGNAEAKRDPFALHLDDPKDPTLRELYLDAEKHDGYIRDRNVFAGEHKWPVTAEDTMAVTARYRRGAILSYSLIAYSPWEGERVTITGDKGQVEYFSRGKGHIIAGQSNEQLAIDQAPAPGSGGGYPGAGSAGPGERYIRVQPMFGAAREVEIPGAAGGHGGGDEAVLERIFNPDAPPDPLNRDASHLDGAASILLGIAAERSIETGKPVEIDELMKLYPPHRQGYFSRSTI